MKFKEVRNIENNVYSVSVMCTGYGRTNLTEEKEKAIIENYGLQLKYEDIEFKGYYKVVDNEVVKGEEADGQEISLELNALDLKIDDKLVAYFEVKLPKLGKNNIGEKLTTQEQVAQAMCLLFVDKIESQITKLIDEAIVKTNSFEGEDEKTL